MIVYILMKNCIKLITIIFIFVLIFFYLTPYLSAAEWQVPGDFENIQEAINNASDDDTIIINKGIYYENIDFSGKAITLRSTDPSNPYIIAETIIDGGQKESVVNFINNEGVGSVLNGISILNGNSSIGGGIFCFSSSPTIVNCLIIGN